MKKLRVGQIGTLHDHSQGKLAAAAILIAMVTGPLGMDEISIGASVCACLIAVAILRHTLRVFRPADRE